MATGNVLLGDVRGSFGALTVRKVAGQTVVSAKIASRKKKKYTYTQMISQAALVTVTRFCSAFKTAIDLGWYSTRSKYSPVDRFKRYAVPLLKRNGKAERKAKKTPDMSVTRFTAKQTDCIVANSFNVIKSNTPNAAFVFNAEQKGMRAAWMPSEYSLQQWIDAVKLFPGRFVVIGIVSVSDVSLQSYSKPATPAATAFQSVAFLRVYRVKQPESHIAQVRWQYASWGNFLEPTSPQSDPLFFNKQLSLPFFISDFHGAAQNSEPEGVGGIFAFTVSELKWSKTMYITNSVMYPVNPQLCGLDYDALAISYAGFIEVLTMADS